MILEFSGLIFERKFSWIKFHENPSRGSRDFPCGLTAVTNVIDVFRNFAKASKNTVQPGGPQMTTRHIRIVCWITKTTGTYTERVTLTTVARNAPQYYVIRTLTVWFVVSLLCAGHAEHIVILLFLYLQATFIRFLCSFLRVMDLIDMCVCVCVCWDFVCFTDSVHILVQAHFLYSCILTLLAFFKINTEKWRSEVTGKYMSVHSETVSVFRKSTVSPRIVFMCLVWL
jgi:hypothetical protein